MSYRSQNGNEVRYNFWSNPSQKHDGIARGVTNESNNTRKLNNTRNSVSAFYSFQLSGTLSEDQTHSGRSFDLTGNLTVPSGITLKIESTASINLNNYYIKSTGGIITLESGATVNPHYCIKSGTTIKGFYPSLNSAISNVVSGQTIEINTATTLANNIAVPSGVTLKRKSGVRITLGSYTVTKASTASIIMETGYYNIPDIRLQSGSTIYGLYPTVGSALTASTTSQKVHIRGTYTNSGHLTVPLGKTLQTESGAQMKFSSNRYLYVNGTLYGNGTTFTRTSGTWGGIKYQSGSSGSISNCTINNATYGLYLYNSSPDIESTNISNSMVYLNNSSSEFTDNYLNDVEGSYLFYIYNSSPDLYNNTIESEEAMLSVNANNGSDPWFGGVNGTTNHFGYNIITASSMADGVIWAQGGSSPMLGYGGAGPYYCGYNSIISSGYYPAAAIDGSSSIDAAWCWWGQYPAPSCYGNVNTADALSSNPGGGSSLDKAGIAPATQTDDKQSPSDELWSSALEYYFKRDISNTIKVLKDIIQVYPDSKNAYKALNLIARIGNSEKSVNSLEIMEELGSDTKNSSMKSGLLAKQVQFHRTAHDYKKAVSLCQTILSDYPDSQKSYYALYDLFNLFQKDLKDTVSANNILEQLKKKYPDSDLTIMARIDNGENVRLEKKHLPKKQLIKMTTETISEEFKLLGNYPNPFNPSTNIRFSLEGASEVTIHIYNVLGQQVRILSQSNLNAGVHQITWDGCNELGKEVTSGLYIMHFEARSSEKYFHDFKRILLIR